MTPLSIVPWGYQTVGPWMASVETANGDYHTVLVYSLSDIVYKLAPCMGSDDGEQRVVAVDARGMMVFGWDHRLGECVGTRQMFDLLLALVSNSDAATMSVIKISDKARLAAAQRGLA